MGGINSIGLNENLNKKESYNKSLGESFDSNKYSEKLATVGQQINEAKTSQQEEANELKKLLMNSEKEKVENFIGEKCSEPIENVKKIMPFKDLLKLVAKSAKEEFDKAQKSLSDHILSAKALKKYINAKQVRNKVRLFTLPDEEKNKLTDTEKKQIKGLAKDKRIYELPAYKKLIEKGFIIPSDIRTSYDSAEQKPVQHLGVDYNVKAGTVVKSIYNGKVLEEPVLDGGLGYKVIIEHEMDDGTGKKIKFYSLYGHLGSKNLPKKGQDIKTGDPIGVVGAPFSKENGNWEEHLHFQIMEKQDSPEGYSKDLQNGQIGNYDVLKSFGKGQ